jgi:hypothetical protein
MNCWNIHRGHLIRDGRRLGDRQRGDVAPQRRSGARRMCRRNHDRRRSRRVLGLCRCGCYGSLAQLLPGSLAGPCAGVDIAHCAQPFFGFGERREVAHVESESLAAFLEAAADEKAESFELGLLRFRERHGRRGGAQVEYERTRLRLGRSGLFNDIVACCAARCRLRRWCHRIFPGPIHKPATVGRKKFLTGKGVRASAPSATVAAPPS